MAHVGEERAFCGVGVVSGSPSFFQLKILGLQHVAGFGFLDEHLLT